MIPPNLSPSFPAAGAPPGPADRLRAAAVALEAGFLKQMLEAAGLGRPPSLGGGLGRGEGEAQFASFLLDAQARRIAEAGGIGLAEHIVRSLERRDG